MQWLGDYKAGDTIDFKFDTSVGGQPSALSAATVRAYKGSSTTESASGITLTTDFDALTGINHVTITLASDGAFYAAGNDFQVVLTAGTVGGVTVRRVLAMFSIENRCVNWAKVTSPTTVVGLSGTTVKTATDVETDTQDIQSRLPAALTGGRIDASVGAMQANVVTAAAIAADAIGASELAADAAAEIATAVRTELTTELGRIDATTSSRATPAQVNAEVLDVVNVDTFAEPGQGAPAATTTLATKLGFLYKFLRNKVTQDTTTLKIFADDAVTVDQKATVSDDGATYTRGEIASGP